MKTSPQQGVLDQDALDYHEYPNPGKISVVPTKALATPEDLSMAYSPGVAAACMAIADSEHPATAARRFTSRGNLVGVITNGTAVLGLGNIGPMAAKPVMEGKACLFKAYAGIDAFDLELASTNSDALIEAIAMLEPTFGGINLEDIKAPECFYIEQKLRERMSIPVFHDDQHGTAIVAAAAIRNGLRIAGKRLEDAKMVVSGAGAAAIACMDLLVVLGMKKENILLADSKGIVFVGRDEKMEPNKARYATTHAARTLEHAVVGQDIFLGCSAAGLLTPAGVKTLAPNALILALANPEPEIRPEVVAAVRSDCIVATGRSDYPNQVNNVLCFPFLFRGALDAGATKITDGMKAACVDAIADLALEDVPADVRATYPGRNLVFGAEYIIPTPFDNRLIERVAPAVAAAAMRDGVATREIKDMAQYRDSLRKLVGR
jgi:malate dehydrogenase (oxaloacetate-decarboxylating)(NADP+)